MKRTARALAMAATLGLVGVLAPPAYAWGPGYYGYGPVAYGGYISPYECFTYTGRDVTAIAVDLVNGRFVHRRVVGPGVIWHRAEYPGDYRMNRNW